VAMRIWRRKKRRTEKRRRRRSVKLEVYYSA
jgi:hypothetical protein